MKNFNKNLFLISLTLFLFSCCRDSETNCSVDISNSIENIENVYGCSNTISNMELVPNIEYRIIENKVDYDNLIIGSCHPTIDFEKYNLVVGNVFNETEVVSIKYKLFKSCEPNFYKLGLTLKYGTNQIINAKNTFHFLISKSENIQILKVNYIVI